MIKYIWQRWGDVLRVISGTKRGYKLKGPKGKDTRPTEDRVKESLFNILGFINEESMVLDLFAGSGSIGIEFLSRGAKKAYFMDRSYLSIKTIKENLSYTDFEGSSQVIKIDSIKAIKLLGNENIKFNYIFVDPPYGKDLIMEVLENLWTRDILFEGGVIIIEHEKGLELGDRAYGFKRIDIRNYGDKSLSFYTN